MIEIKKIKVNKKELKCGRCKYFREEGDKGYYCSIRRKWVKETLCEKFKLLDSVFELDDNINISKKELGRNYKNTSELIICLLKRNRRSKNRMWMNANDIKKVTDIKRRTLDQNLCVIRKKELVEFERRQGVWYYKYKNT